MKLYTVTLNGILYHVRAASTVSAMLLCISEHLEACQSPELTASAKRAEVGVHCEAQDCLYCDCQPPERDAQGRFRR